jgi:hypothetical protein
LQPDGLQPIGIEAAPCLVPIGWLGARCEVMVRQFSQDLIKISACLARARYLGRLFDAGQRDPDHTISTRSLDLLAAVENALVRLRRSLSELGYHPPRKKKAVALPHRKFDDVSLDHALSELWDIAHFWDRTSFAQRMEKLEWAIETTRQWIADARQDEQNAESSDARASATPQQDQNNNGDDKQLRDGFFEPDKFRFKGKTIQFKRAVLQYRLLKGLWDTKKKKPRGRPENDVINSVYGEDDLGSSNKFIQLCFDTNNKLLKETVPLKIERLQGTVYLRVL